MADCCEPGCSDEVLCPVHQALADLRAQIANDIEAQAPFTTHADDCECADCTTRNVMLSCIRIARGGTDE